MLPFFITFGPVNVVTPTRGAGLFAGTIDNDRIVHGGMLGNAIIWYVAGMCAGLVDDVDRVVCHPSHGFPLSNGLLNRLHRV